MAWNRTQLEEAVVVPSGADALDLDSAAVAPLAKAFEAELAKAPRVEEALVEAPHAEERLVEATNVEEPMRRTRRRHHPRSARRAACSTTIGGGVRLSSSFISCQR